AATGGTGGYTYSILSAKLPNGVTLNPTTGVISGTPTEYGTFSYVVQVKDSQNNTATTGATSCTLTIAPPPLAVICVSANTGQQGPEERRARTAPGARGGRH